MVSSLSQCSQGTVCRTYYTLPPISALTSDVCNYTIYDLYINCIISNTFNVLNTLISLAVAGVSLKKQQQTCIKFYKVKYWMCLRITAVNSAVQTHSLLRMNRKQYPRYLLLILYIKAGGRAPQNDVQKIPCLKIIQQNPRFIFLNIFIFKIYLFIYILNYFAFLIYLFGIFLYFLNRICKTRFSFFFFFRKIFSLEKQMKIKDLTVLAGQKEHITSCYRTEIISIDRPSCYSKK